jgi:hypothetical protein
MRGPQAKISQRTCAALVEWCSVRDIPLDPEVARVVVDHIVQEYVVAERSLPSETEVPEESLLFDAGGKTYSFKISNLRLNLTAMLGGVVDTAFGSDAILSNHYLLPFFALLVVLTIGGASVTELEEEDASVLCGVWELQHSGRRVSVASTRRATNHGRNARGLDALTHRRIEIVLEKLRRHGVVRRDVSASWRVKERVIGRLKGPE